MKRILLSCFFLLAITFYANEDDNLIKTDNSSVFYLSILDPGHGKQVKNQSKWPELYIGLQPSVAIKYNFGHNTNITETGYMMLGMDFDSDLFLKFGFIFNKGSKKSQNRSLFPHRKMGFLKLWRYVMVRQGVELGYKGQFLDAEENEFLNTNYGGLTANYTLIFDGNFLFDKTSWYFFDHRTARRIRLKIDAGLFMNFDKFDQPDLGFLSGSNDATGQDYSEDVTDENGIEQLIDTYPVISPFVNFSIGFAF
tara:strand:+ start:1080 stop:1838 length:759 start_codon:yes stop_codon:yes gene_type:complete